MNGWTEMKPIALGAAVALVYSERTLDMRA